MKYFYKNIRATRLTGFTTGIELVCVMLIIIMTGCRKDFKFDKVKDLTWNPDIALPLVNDSITLQKILTQGQVEKHLYIDESGNISILYYYNNDAFRLRPAKLIKLLPVYFDFLHQVTQAEQDILSVSDLTLPPVPFDIPLDGNNPEMRVDKLLIKNGAIVVTTNHTFNNDGNLSVRFLNATKNGQPFSTTIEPFVAGQTQKKIDISGVLFDLSSSPNIIKLEVGGLLKKSGRPMAGDEINAVIGISIDTIGKFEGYLGHQLFTQLMDTVRVNVFNNAYTLGEVYFKDPQATITIVNSIGVPANITVEKFTAINTVSGITYDIADRLGAGSYFQVPIPSFPLTSPAIRTMYYNNANTGNAMYDFFNVKPDRAAFQIKTEINPPGTQFNFFSDTSSFYGDLRVKLPLWGHFDHLTFQDTFDLKLEKPEDLEYLEFRTNIENGLPMTGLLQVYFTDASYNKKDSLAGSDQILIHEAPVDPATYLPYPGMFGLKDTIYILNRERMLNLKNVNKMLVKAVLFSADNGLSDVKLRASQVIKLRFSARVKIRKTIQPGK